MFLKPFLLNRSNEKDTSILSDSGAIVDCSAPPLCLAAMSGILSRDGETTERRESTPPPAKRSSAAVSSTVKSTAQQGSPASPKQRDKAYSRFVGDITRNVAEIDAKCVPGDLGGVAVATRDAIQELQKLIQLLAHVLNEYGLGLETHHAYHHFAVQAHGRQKATAGDLRK